MLQPTSGVQHANPPLPLLPLHLIFLTTRSQQIRPPEHEPIHFTLATCHPDPAGLKNSCDPFSGEKVSATSLVRLALVCAFICGIIVFEVQFSIQFNFIVKLA